MSDEDARPDTDDIAAPPGGGLFCRLGAAGGSAGGSAGAAFSVFEEIFAPARHEARIEIEHQRRVGRPAPAPGDPADLGSEPGAASRFHGTVVIRRS